MVILLIFAVILLILWIILTSYLGLTLFYTVKNKKLFVPFLPSDTKGIQAMLRAASLKGDENIVDIGSGWGTIVFEVAKSYPQACVTGIELHPVLFLISKVVQFLFYRRQKITLVRGDAAAFSYESYNIVFLFMLSTFVDEVIAPKLEKELKPGAKVISYVFKMNSSSFTEKVITLPSAGWRNKIYVYTKK